MGHPPENKERPIVLPPLPSWEPSTSAIWDGKAMAAYALEAIRQDRMSADRAAAEKKAGPVVQRAHIHLTNAGTAHQHRDGEFHHFGTQHRITLAWTPEWVIIDSERNRGLARKLRYLFGQLGFTVCKEAADALDGGVSP